MDDDQGKPRAFLTYSARAASSVAPLVARAEALLHDLGWRTRLPRRAGPREPTSLAERRRLREMSQAEVRRAAVVITVPGGASLAGKGLHRELGHALRHGIPIVLLVASDARDELGIERPGPRRLRELAALTGGAVVERLRDIEDILPGPRLVR